MIRRTIQIVPEANGAAPIHKPAGLSASRPKATLASDRSGLRRGAADQAVARLGVSARFAPFQFL